MKYGKFNDQVTTTYRRPISTRKSWDGKYGELPMEENIDLSDVDLNNLEKNEL